MNLNLTVFTSEHQPKQLLKACPDAQVSAVGGWKSNVFFFFFFFRNIRTASIGSN